MSASFHITQHGSRAVVSPADSIVRISLSGVPSRHVIRVEMSTVSRFYCINVPGTRYLGARWSACAEYLSQDSGCVDMCADPSIGGSFTGLHPMGLFYCMEPHGNGHPRNPEYCENLPPEHSEFRLRAWCDGAVLCETKLRRRNLPQGASCELIDDPDYRGMLYVPNNLSVSRTAQGPAVIVLSGSDGGIAKAQNIAQLLCGHGFAAMAVGYFGLEGLPGDLNAIPLEIIEKAAWFLARRNDVDSRRIGLYGRSKGAEMALAAAQRVPLIHAVVANSPSCQVMEGLRGALPSRSSSWTWRGEELPYRRFGIRDLADRLARRVTTAAQLAYDSPCAIRAEDITAPLLMLASTHDEIWPALPSALALARRRENGHATFATRIMPCASVGHMLTLPWLPNPRYPVAARHDNAMETYRMWQATVDFFSKQLSL